MISICCFLALSSFRAYTQTIAEDDQYALFSAEGIYNHGKPDNFSKEYNFPQHPYLYQYVIASAFYLFGKSEISARLIGIISGLLSVLLVFFIVRLFRRTEDQYLVTKRATIIAALYALAPTTIEGTSIIQIDNTILVPAVLFLFFSSIKYFQNRNICWLFFVSLSVALLLWMRLSTPILVIFILGMHTMLCRYDLTVKLRFICALFSGIALFILSWLIYCKMTGVNFFGPFMYTLLIMGKDTSGSSSLFRISEKFVYFSLWTGLFFVPAIFLIIIGSWKNLFKNLFAFNPYFIFVAGVILAAVYTILGNVSFAYPRYQSPAIPLLYIGSYLIFFENNFNGFDFKKGIPFLIIALFMQLFIAGDILYALRYTLRQYLSYGSLSFLKELHYVLFRLICLFIGYYILFRNFLKTFSGRHILNFLIGLSIASALAMTVLQAKASYNTGYNYGASGTREAVQYVLKKIPHNGIVLGPLEFIYYLRSANSEYLDNFFWNNAFLISKKLREPETAAFIYSVSTNSIQQIRAINNNPIIKDLLNENFTHKKIGSYDIWLRSNKKTTVI